jgi:hypothetical protein
LSFIFPLDKIELRKNPISSYCPFSLKKKIFLGNLQAVSEEKYEKMVEEQLEKLRQEKESRARDGAPTPPSPGT